MVFGKKSANEGWTLVDLYRIGPAFPLQFLVYGTLHAVASQASAEKKFIMESNVAPASNRRRDLKGLIIPCGLAVGGIGISGNIALLQILLIFLNR